MGKEAEHAFTVVGRHADHALLGDGASVVTGLAARTGHQSATIKIDQYRKGIRCGRCGRPDIQIETVLATLGTTERHIAEDIGLHRVVAKPQGLTNTFPSLQRLGGLPTQFANRSLCEGYAQELLHAILFETFEDAILGFHLKGDFRSLLLCASTEDHETCDDKHHE